MITVNLVYACGTRVYFVMTCRREAEMTIHFEMIVSRLFSAAVSVLCFTKSVIFDRVALRNQRLLSCLFLPT